ncbi:Queuosine salvage protein [Golovinomyces cichoracearum]|uniref:Queuosine 5'-phosphate N-glycosylase/hydrolase n=1 Tax=Golovinomyces cichoracearum TaxID=62708 RepID=A0A420HB14_9PEZI|nr:Queuosine salvage protein [Golovinomyces cichoracearum]
MSSPTLESSLFDFLRQQYLDSDAKKKNPEFDILTGAEHVFNNSIDVSLNLHGVKKAASSIYSQMQAKDYCTKKWLEHELHPKAKDESTVNFIFTLSLINFSVWLDLPNDEQFSIDYKGKTWTGYCSLVAALQRALDEGIPITSQSFWIDEEKCTDDVLKHVFRSAAGEDIPLFQERVNFLREAGKIINEKYNGSFLGCIKAAEHSAIKLVNLLAYDFPCFDDVFSFEEKDNIRFMMRAQTCVAYLWDAFDGEDYGCFQDINKIVTSADYRIPQALNNLGCMSYSPPLENAIRTKKMIKSGHSWEIQIRGCSVWCIELIRREIAKFCPESESNSMLVEIFLRDIYTFWEAQDQPFTLPHHRTRSVWY